MTENEPDIHDNTEAGRWEIAAEGAIAWLSYAMGPSVLVLVHTEVPERLGGRGLAGRLARHAMEIARVGGLKVEPQCPFMIGWLDRHGEYADLVFKPSGPAADEPFWF
ncbi:MAG: N-acetyltransferase [Gemmatimonadota bacterium]|nr:N-acetyltransferase [Gemmatimonadota bacterium]